jgi:hypothetical protein
MLNPLENNIFLPKHEWSIGMQEHANFVSDILSIFYFGRVTVQFITDDKFYQSHQVNGHLFIYIPLYQLPEDYFTRQRPFRKEFIQLLYGIFLTCKTGNTFIAQFSMVLVSEISKKYSLYQERVNSGYKSLKEAEQIDDWSTITLSKAWISKNRQNIQDLLTLT